MKTNVIKRRKKIEYEHTKTKKNKIVNELFGKENRGNEKIKLFSTK